MMNTNDEILLIPDVHGREFWKKCFTFPGKIYFLGDYHDPYGFEYDPNGSDVFDGTDIHYNVKENDYKKESYDNFQEIIEFARQNKDRVFLLYGNHDFHYIHPQYNSSRKDKLRAEDIMYTFIDNRDLFKFYYIVGNLLLTHAGISKPYYDIFINQKIEADPTKDFVYYMDNLNPRELFQVSSYRGGWCPASSFIWLDYHEIDKYTPIWDDKYAQIFGHTMQIEQGNIVRSDNWASIDSRECFAVNPYLDNKLDIINSIKVYN